MAGKTKGRAPRSFSQSTAALTMTSMLAIPRLPAPTATVSPRLMGSPAEPSAPRTPAGMTSTRGRANAWRTRTILGTKVASAAGMPGMIQGGSRRVNVLDFQSKCPYNYHRLEPDSLPMRPNLLAVSSALAALLILAGGCSSIVDWIKQRPQPLPPASDLYSAGEAELDKGRNAEARASFLKIVERHPQSMYAPRARFLIGEAYYRESEWDKAIKEFETFLSFYPRHQIADLVQYRLAMSYYDQLKPVEQDQMIAKKAMEAFKTLVREYPESRYAADALGKIDVCRGRLAQKELFVASYYLNQGNHAAARQRLEGVIKDYPRTLVIPEALYRLGEVYAVDGRTQEAQDAFRRCATEYSYTEWGRRALQRLKTAAR